MEKYKVIEILDNIKNLIEIQDYDKIKEYIEIQLKEIGYTKEEGYIENLINELK